MSKKSFLPSYRTILVLFAIFLLSFFLVVVRSKTLPDFQDHPAIFIYGILIFAFYIARVFASLFFKKSLQAVTLGLDTDAYEPRISFVIPAKNEESAIEDTIRTCFASSYPKNMLEVIVINDGSTDKTGTIIKNLEKEFPQLIAIHWEKNRGKRHGMAEGFRRSTGEIVVVLDSDSYIEPESLREIVKPFANPVIGAVCGHAYVTNKNTNFVTKMQSAYYFVSFRIMKAAESVFYSVFCCSGCSSAYRKSIVMPILDQWLNETFMGQVVTYGDDRSLTTWILKAGYKTVYTDLVRAYTIVPDTLKKLFKQQLRWKKSWIINSIFTAKFLIKKDPFSFFTYFFPLVVFSFIGPLIGIWTIYMTPALIGTNPVFYITGIGIMTVLFLIYYRILAPKDDSWPYLFVWQFFSMFFLSYIIFYALVRLNDRGWGTR